MDNRGMRVHITKELILELLHLKGLKATILNAWSNQHEQVCIEFVGSDKKMPLLDGIQESILNCKVLIDERDEGYVEGKIIGEE